MRKGQKRQRITLTNHFHNSEVTILGKRNGYLSPGQVRRIEKELCGCESCACGRTVRDENGWILDYLSDGGAILRNAKLDYNESMM